MVGRGIRVVAFLGEHALGCAIAAAVSFWGLDALIHTVGAGESFLQHLVSGEAHDLAPRLFTAALLVGLGFGVQNEHLRRRAEAKMQESERRFRALAAAAPVGVLECDAAGRTVYANDRAAALLGLPAPACLGEGWAQALHEDDRVRVLQRREEALREGRVFREECRLVHWDGEIVWAICEAAPLGEDAAAVTGWIVSVTDISERREFEKRLESAAYTDELTGLFNRRGFFALAGKQLEIALRSRDSVGLVYVDLNRMKEINDRWGHEAGDRALRDVAEILNRTFRTSDILGRIGGDEFVAFLPDAANADTRGIVLANLQRQLADHNARVERPFTLALSAGVSVSTAGVACSIEELVTRADRDMYRQKRLGRGPARALAGPARRTSAPRLSARIPIEGVAAELSSGGAAQVVDISLGGVCLGTALPLRVGERLGVRIPVDGEGALALSGSVVWAEQVGPESSDPRRFRSGLRFVEIDGKLQGTLVQLIAGHC